MRSRLLWVVLCIGALVGTACGQPDTGPQGNAASVGSPDAAIATIAATVGATVPVEITPTINIGVDVTADEMAVAAIDFSYQREVVVSGEPQALLAMPGTPHTFYSLGLNVGNWEPTCARPMYLVILKGDFDGANLFTNPGSDGEDEGPFGQYLAYVFDLNGGAPGDVMFSILSEDGGIFKRALGDSSLPDKEINMPKLEPPYVPCENVLWEGEPDSQEKPEPANP